MYKTRKLTKILYIFLYCLHDNIDKHNNQWSETSKLLTNTYICTIILLLLSSISFIYLISVNTYDIQLNSSLHQWMIDIYK